MSQYAPRVKAAVDAFLESEMLDAALEPVRVFSDRDDLDSPTVLTEEAQRVAAQREFVAEVLGEAARTLGYVSDVTDIVEGEYNDGLDRKLSENAGRLISKGFAIDERRAEARMAMIQEAVDLRACELQRNKMKSYERQLRDIHSEWRAAEFTIDRLVRITNVRLAIGEF